MQNEYRKPDMDEQEIDLVDLMGYALKGWRKMLIVGIIVGILLGGYNLYGQVFKSEEAHEKEITEYTNYLNKIEATEMNLELTRVQLKEAQEYIDNSVRYQMDFEKAITVVTNYYVTMDDAVITDQFDPIDTALNVYTMFTASDEYWTDLEAFTGLDRKYIPELLWVSANAGANTISVGSRHLTVELAQALNDHVTALLESQSDAVTAAFPSAKLTKTGDYVQIVRDESIRDNKLARDQAIKDYNQKIEDLMNEQEDLAKKPVSDPGRLHFGSVAKMCILGGIVGVMLMAVWYAAAYLLNGKVHTADELNSLYGMAMLGAFTYEDKKKGIDGLHQKLFHKVNEPDETVLTRIANNLDNLAGDAQLVLLTGQVDHSVLNELKSSISSRMTKQVELVTGANVATNPDTLKLYAACDAIVLVESKESKVRLVQGEVECAGRLAKPMIGYIMK